MTQALVIILTDPAGLGWEFQDSTPPWHFPSVSFEIWSMTRDKAY